MSTTIQAEPLGDYARRVRTALALVDPGFRDGFEVMEGKMPSLPPLILAPEVRLLMGEKLYHRQQRAERIEILASSETLEALGLVLVARLLEPASAQVYIDCTAARAVASPDHLSELRGISLSSTFERLRPHGLVGRAAGYRYRPRDVGRYPLSPAIPHELPHAFVDDREGSGAERLSDTLHGFGTLAGTAALAGALFDMAAAAREGGPTEFDFEVPYALGGVAPGSVELKFWLPNSIGWELYPP